MTIRLFLFLFTVSVISADPCPGDWVHHESSCYAFITGAPDGWTEAMLYCQALQAKLVEVETSEENSYLRLHLFDIGRQSSVDFWMGMTDLVAEGHWRWMSTQSNATFMDWYPGEPNNGNDEDCATFGINYSWHWNDVDCTAKLNYICEKSIKEEVSVIG